MTTLQRNTIIGVFLVAVSLTLASCGKPGQQPLPQGTLSFTGSLVQAELSLTRRGTHILRQNGHDALYVESSKVNLNQYEGMDVTITGHLEPNSDPSAQPVIVADSVSLIQVPSHDWNLPALKMSFSAPLAWQGSLYTDGVSFTETGSMTPILKIYRSSLNVLPPGTPLVVGGQGAVKTTTASGDVIYVQNGSDIIAIEAAPQLSVSTGNNSEQQNLERLLKSVTFTGSSSSSFGSGTVIPAGTGSTAGMPCGGPAGILCPAGSFCEITDRTSGIGVCQSLSH
ncbi:MAG TPA: hypothetical protein VHA78_05385 [Candidatus Peribacteraceae bacterium]|nr:hypothetical protein [Candidatus Peribacteraceae bacterium]